MTESSQNLCPTKSGNSVSVVRSRRRRRDYSDSHQCPISLRLVAPHPARKTRFVSDKLKEAPNKSKSLCVPSPFGRARVRVGDVIHLLVSSRIRTTKNQGWIFMLSPLWPSPRPSPNGRVSSDKLKFVILQRARTKSGPNVDTIGFV